MIKKAKETSTSLELIVHSKKYQLTHLLEVGHGITTFYCITIFVVLI